MTRGNSITAAQARRIKELWQEQADTRDIARALGLSKSTVANVLRDMDDGVMVRTARCVGCGNLVSIWPCWICRARG
jgi:DNA-binding MarR family transcriptional regulator